MTEKRYKMVNTNLVDDDGLVYYLIKKDGRDVCQVFGKHTAKAIVTELNALYEENEQLKQFKEQHIEEYLKLKTVSNELKRENEQLKKELESFRPIIFESDGKPVTLYKKGGDVE